MKITDVKILVGYGVINMDVYRIDKDTDIPEDAIRADYAIMEQLAAERGLDKGDKYACREYGEYNLFREPFYRAPTESSPGGSILNTLDAIGHSLCGIKPRLVAFIGNGLPSFEIRAMCQASMVSLHEIPMPHDYRGSPDLPENLVVQPYSGGERILIKSPCEVIDKAMEAHGVRKEWTEGADAFFVQGASIIRFGMSFLRNVSNHLDNKYIVFSLPTVKKYPANLSRTDLNHIKDFVFQKTNLLSCTSDEFKALFGADYTAALRELRDGWRNNPLAEGDDPRLALITDGGNPATLYVEGWGVMRVCTRQGMVAAHKVGAGDAALGGFIAGLKKGMPPHRAARLAMEFGAIKTAQTARVSVIHNLLGQLENLRGTVTGEYLARIRGTYTGQTQVKYSVG